MGDGQSLRDHLEAAERQTGRTPPRLAAEPIPECFSRQMRIWGQLNRRRQVGFGPSPFTWGDLDAFCRVTGEQLSNLDLIIVDIIEGEYFASREAAAKAKPDNPAP